MTGTDWFGTVLAIIIFIIITTAYFYAFIPKNKDKLEKYGNIPLNDEGENDE